MSPVVVDAEVLVRSQNELGEGILWDDRLRRVFWVDILRAEIHSWSNEQGHKVLKLKDEQFISAIAPRKSGPGFVAALKSRVVLIDPEEYASTQTVTTVAEPLSSPEGVRFNDGACDAAGRFWIGSMALDEGENKGELYRIDERGAEHILQDVGTSNGIDWSPDNKTMYYVDSEKHTVDAFDFDVQTGTLSNRRRFAKRPLSAGGRQMNLNLGIVQMSFAFASSKNTEPGDEAEHMLAPGLFDGLVVDGVGNVWVARWGDSRVIVYNPAGKIIAQVRTPGARSPTIPCFGGDDLSTLYIATANADLAGQGKVQDQYPESGNVYKLDITPGSALRKALGAEWKGRVRHRYAG